LNHLIHNVSPKFQTFQKICNVRQLFSQNCFEESHAGLKWCCVATSAYTVVAVNIWAQGVGNYHTGAQLLLYSATRVAELGPAGMRLHFLNLQFPHWAAPQWWPACTPVATYVAHFFQANFELHLYNVEK
jgi:hypothetical protein